MTAPSGSVPERTRADAEGIRRAAVAITEAAVVAVPTETSYGLAADALDPLAVARVLAIKGRSEGHQVSVLVADRAMLARVAARISPVAEELMARHWPGALTLVVPAREGLPAALVNSTGGVGVRISSDPVVQALLRAVGRPITATSANRSGEPAATEAEGAGLAGVALVLDDGPRCAPASTVVDVTGVPVVLRQGAVVI